MPNKIRIKRSTVGGTQAPGSLDSGELAYESGRDILYIGRDIKGENGASDREVVASIAGSGAFVAKLGNQTDIDGIKTFKGSDESSSQIVIGENALLKTDIRGQATVPQQLLKDGDGLNETSEQIVGVGYINKNFITNSLNDEKIKGTKKFDVAPVLDKEIVPDDPGAKEFAVVQYVNTTVQSAKASLKLNDESLVPPDSGDNRRNIDVSGLRITDLATPVADSDAATRKYVDGPRKSALDMGDQVITKLKVDQNDSSCAVNKEYVDNRTKGLRVFPSCKVATTTAIPGWNSDNDNPPTRIDNGSPRVIDEIAIEVGDIILFKDQTDNEEEDGFSKVNGIYVVPDDDENNQPQPVQRITRLETDDDAHLVFTFINQGTVNGDHGFVCTNDEGKAKVGTDALGFNKFSDAQGGTPITGGAAIDVEAGRVNVVSFPPLVIRTSSEDPNVSAITIDYEEIGHFLAGSPESNSPTPVLTFDNTYSKLTIDLGRYGA